MIKHFVTILDKVIPFKEFKNSNIFFQVASADTVLLSKKDSQTESQLLSWSCDLPSENASKEEFHSLSLISDDEGDKDEPLTQVTKKKAKRLVLSDDESETEQIESDIEEDAEPKEVMYDSEENEVEVPVFKGFVGKKG